MCVGAFECTNKKCLHSRVSIFSAATFLDAVSQSEIFSLSRQKSGQIFRIPRRIS